MKSEEERADEGPPVVEHARLATGCLWGAPLSLGLWAAILYLVWRLFSS